jgi:hypothetical protein
MSVKSNHNMECPSCSSDESIIVAVTLWVTLVSDGTDIGAQDHEWTDESQAECFNCRFTGIVADFTEEK